ncbi:hypothetical protein BDV29DRAFT_160571 [Aspergillus leporis]|jgi:hypothetical protein|uniref:DAPG hydrolase PhiG domain-containing protein n=1 Tax=Aspergillus leporis TaxID=41062 RepID=A0A5N5WT29_9EURO|nr:hypothetical protein BDV29DRAFT_160571 [Aspergillus leporis]
MDPHYWPVQALASTRFLRLGGAPGNNGDYIRGHHLLHKYIAGELAKLKVSFKDLAEYFSSDWKEQFRKAGYSTAVCGRVGNGDSDSGELVYVGHHIHLIKDEPYSVRMRSRFWFGDVEGVKDPERGLVPEKVPKNPPMVLLKHATEETAILASIFPDMFSTHAGKERSHSD